MPAQIQFHPSLAQFTGGTMAAEVEASTVGQALAQVARMVPGLGARLLNCEGELRSVFRLTHNGSPAAATDPVEDGDVLELSLG